MWKGIPKQHVPYMVRHYSKDSPPSSVCTESVIRVSKNIAHLGLPKKGPKPPQLLSLPPFPAHPLPGKNLVFNSHVTAISWIKYYFDEVPGSVVQSHFNKGHVSIFAFVFSLQFLPFDWRYFL